MVDLLKTMMLIQHFYKQKGEKAPVLNVILKYLKGLGKIIDNKDGSWTWIYAANNKKLKKSYGQAINL